MEEQIVLDSFLDKYVNIKPILIGRTYNLDDYKLGITDHSNIEKKHYSGNIYILYIPHR